MKIYDQYNSGRIELTENWNEVKRMLDISARPLDKIDIIHMFSDLIDNDVIEVIDIVKIYRLGETTRTTKGIKYPAYYGIIKYDISIKIIDIERAPEYVDYRDSIRYGLLKEYYGYSILNGRPSSYFKMWNKDIDTFDLNSRGVVFDRNKI